MTIAPSRQRGATLVISLILLAVILLLGTATASLLVLDERAARNHRAHQQAALAAQAALDDACDEIRRGTRTMAAVFPENGCHADAGGRGLCRGQAGVPGWRPGQLDGTEPGSAAYGEFTGALPPDANIAAPRYLIELLPGQREALYRISAIGFGPNAAVARLQAVAARRVDSAGHARCVPLSWRALSLQ